MYSFLKNTAFAVSGLLLPAVLFVSGTYFLFRIGGTVFSPSFLRRAFSRERCKAADDGLKRKEDEKNLLKSEKTEIDSEIQELVNLRQEAKKNKDWATADFIRNRLAEIGFDVKDTKEGVEWKLNK